MPRGDIADNQPLTITELEGQLRTVTLDGAKLPEWGLEAPLELRQVTTRYPTGQTSTQIMGIEEKPITLECTFNDVLTGVFEDAIATVETLRSILTGYAPVQLEWGAALVRRGYLTGVNPKYKLESLIGCTITFLPIESDEVFYQTTPMPQPSSADVLTWMDQLTSALDALNSAMSYEAGIAALFG